MGRLNDSISFPQKAPAMKNILIIIASILVCNKTIAQSDTDYLPVRLASFDVSADQSTAKLHWNTICYLQYANFQIQKSDDGLNFKTIHSFTADKLRCTQPFDFDDSVHSNLGNVYYRINVGNIDGEFFYSAIRSVFLKEVGFDLLPIYPTVVTKNLNFSLANNKDERFQALIVNGEGNIVRKQQFWAINGIARFKMTTHDLTSGYYWLRVITGKGKVSTQAFLKQN